MIDKAELEEIRARYNWADRDGDMWPDEPLEVSFRDIPRLIEALEEAWGETEKLRGKLLSVQGQLEYLQWRESLLRKPKNVAEYTMRFAELEAEANKQP